MAEKRIPTKAEIEQIRLQHESDAPVFRTDRGDLLSALTDMTRQRDEAREVCDALVEGAIQQAFERAAKVADDDAVKLRNMAAGWRMKPCRDGRDELDYMRHECACAASAAMFDKCAAAIRALKIQLLSLPTCASQLSQLADEMFPAQRPTP